MYAQCWISRTAAPRAFTRSNFSVLGESARRKMRRGPLGCRLADSWPDAGLVLRGLLKPGRVGLPSVAAFNEAEREFRLVLCPQATQHARQKLVRRVLGGLALGVFERIALTADRTTNPCLASGGGRDGDGSLAAAYKTHFRCLRLVFRHDPLGE
jgi:hypothetical protein